MMIQFKFDVSGVRSTKRIEKMTRTTVQREQIDKSFIAGKISCRNPQTQILELLHDSQDLEHHRKRCTEHHRKRFSTRGWWRGGNFWISHRKRLLCLWAYKLRMRFDTIRSEFAIIHAFPFNSEKKPGGVDVLRVISRSGLQFLKCRTNKEFVEAFLVILKFSFIGREQLR